MQISFSQPFKLKLSKRLNFTLEISLQYLFGAKRNLEYLHQFYTALIAHSLAVISDITVDNHRNSGRAAQPAKDRTTRVFV